jgi:hypothetical protein
MSESNNDNTNDTGAQGAWYGDVSAESISDIEANNWNGVEDVIKGYKDLKNQGSDFKIPDGSNSDEMNSFYNKLGRPDTIDGYDFDMVEVDHDSSFKGFKEAAHRNGLTSTQAEGMYKDFDNFVKTEYEQADIKVKEENEKTIAELKQEWGKDYEGKMEGARKAFADMGLDDNIAEDVGKLLGVGNTVKLFDALANGSKEHQFLDDGGATGTTEQAIQDEIYEITHKPEYMDDNKNKLLVRRVTALYKQLHPEK